MKLMIDADYLIHAFTETSRIDTKIDSLISAFKVRMEDCYFFLGTSFNFRKDVFNQYKGKRKEKEPHVETNKKYIARTYPSYYVKGIEADDAIIIFANLFREEGIDVAIVSADKDARQYEGKLIDFRSLMLSEIKTEIVEKSSIKMKNDVFTTETTFSYNGEYFLCLQMLTGDTVDNISGLKGVGEITAKKMIPYGTSLEQAWEIVYSAYVLQCGERAKEEFILNYKLLKILQTNNNLTTKNVNKQ